MEFNGVLQHLEDIEDITTSGGNGWLVRLSGCYGCKIGHP